MTSVIMTIAAIVMLGLILASWYAIKAILTIKGDAAVVIRELESIHSAIANNDDEIAKLFQSIATLERDIDQLRAISSNSSASIGKLGIDLDNIRNDINMVKADVVIQGKSFNIAATTFNLYRESSKNDIERIERNAEEMSRVGNEYTNHSIAEVRSYIDQRIDKSSNKTLHIDESELIKSVKDLVMSFRNAK